MFTKPRLGCESALASASIGPTSAIDGNYHYEHLDEPLSMSKGNTYRISQNCFNGMTPWYDGTPTSELTWSSNVANVERGVFGSNRGGFPDESHGYIRWVPVVTFYYTARGLSGKMS